MNGFFASLPLRAVAGAWAALTLSGCTASPAEPACYATVGATDAASQMCRVEHAQYAAYEAAPLSDRLVSGDRNSWADTAKAIFGATLLGFGLYHLTTGRHGGTPRDDEDVRHTPAAFVPAENGPAPRPLESLVGMQVTYRGECFTVLDDSAPAMDPARRFGGRAAVTALDSHDAVGLLFLGFDAKGALIEAATGSEPWAAAHISI